LFGSGIDDFNSGQQLELRDRPSQEVDRTASRVEQDETKIPAFDREHKAWQSTT
jgi:hypothetical protein